MRIKKALVGVLLILTAVMAVVPAGLAVQDHLLLQACRVLGLEPTGPIQVRTEPTGPNTVRKLVMIEARVTRPDRFRHCGIQDARRGDRVMLFRRDRAQRMVGITNLRTGAWVKYRVPRK